MSENRGGGMGGVLITLGAVGLMVACCAGPALIAAGGLAVAAGALRSWPVLAVAGLVVAAAVVYTLVRTRRRSTARSVDANSTAPDRVAEQVPLVMVDDCCALPPKRARVQPAENGAHSADRAGRP